MKGVEQTWSVFERCWIAHNVSCLGTPVFAEIQGVIEAYVRLSGMPDLTLSFMVGWLPLSVLINCLHCVQYTVPVEQLSDVS